MPLSAAKLSVRCFLRPAMPAGESSVQRSSWPGKPTCVATSGYSVIQRRQSASRKPRNFSAASDCAFESRCCESFAWARESSGKARVAPAIARATNMSIRIITVSSRRRASRACRSRLLRCGREFPFAFAREHHDQARGFRRIHRSVVDKDGVGGAHQRRHFAFAVAFVAFANFFEHLCERQILALFLVLFPAPLRANFRRRLKKYFQLGIRKNNSANVAPFHHNAAASPGALLLRNKHGAHRRDSGQTRGRLRNLWRANLLCDFCAIQEDAIFYSDVFLLRGWRAKLDVRFVCELCQLRFVIDWNSALQRFERQRAIHRAAVEIEIAKRPGDKTRYATFAGTGGAVDRDGEFGHGLIGRF